MIDEGTGIAVYALDRRKRVGYWGKVLDVVRGEQRRTQLQSVIFFNYSDFRDTNGNNVPDTGGGGEFIPRCETKRVLFAGRYGGTNENDGKHDFACLISIISTLFVQIFIIVFVFSLFRP